jgi:NADPH:quinone reductase-like Zn-dependent oxidoreductase
MRAAVLPGPSGPPAIEDFEDPKPVDGSVVIELTTAGLGAWDILGMYREAIEFPCVIRGEGVGHAEGGRRVYFGEHSPVPFGAWAEKTVVPEAEVWGVPDDVDDVTAINLAIAGTGAFVPLEQAQIQKGESVLVVGATGAVGQLGLQLARRLGAGRVVAAARDEKALGRLVERGVADAAVALGSDDDDAALKAEAGDGFDVVLDIVYGEPFVAALKATRMGARVMSIGVQAGITAPVFLPDMLSRTHTCVGTGQIPPEERHQIWLRLIDLHREQEMTVDTLEFTLDQAPEAWAAQVASPHAKILGRIAS